MRNKLYRHRVFFENNRWLVSQLGVYSSTAFRRGVLHYRLCIQSSRPLQCFLGGTGSRIHKGIYRTNVLSRPAIQH